MRTFSLGFATLAALSLSACGRGASPAANAATPDGAMVVATATAVERAMPLTLRTVGNVEPFSSLEVHSSLSGNILTITVEDDQDVRQGDVLFTIDPRPFELELKEAQASLAKDTAQSKTTEAQRARFAELYKNGVLSRTEFESMSAQSNAAQAAIAADTAAIEAVKKQLDSTKIVAPGAGRASGLTVTHGSPVRAGEGAPLVIINELSPVYVSFTVPGRSITQIRDEQTRAPLAVEAALPADDKGPLTGSLSFVDSVADPLTDTVRVKATFSNDDQRLSPGQSVEVMLHVSNDPQAIVIPSTAVQTGPLGTFVWVVQADQTVAERPVTVSRTEGPDSAIESGLRVGEVVVNERQLRLTAGTRVRSN